MKPPYQGPLALLPLLLVVVCCACSFLPCVWGSCPAGCGLTSGPQNVSFNTAADAIYPGVSSPPTCASLCSNFQYWVLNATEPLCLCYFSCSSFSTIPNAEGTTYIGLVQACNPPGAVAAPICPSSVYYSGNAYYGYASNDPAVVDAASGLDSPLSCLLNCAANAPGSYFYQFASSNNSAFGFLEGDCYCLSSCTTTKLLSLAPMTFVQGSLCAAAEPATSLFPGLPPPGCPLSISAQSSLLSCAPSGKTCSTNGVTTQGYSCSLCNPKTSVLALGDVQLTCSNFDPVSASGVSPGCLVPGAIKPGCCSSFSFQNPVALGIPTLQITSDPFTNALVSTVASSTGAGGALALGPCAQKSAGSDSVGAVYTFSCALLNTGLSNVGDIVFDCSNFIPLSGSGSLNPDCTLSSILKPLAATSFSFSTHAADIVISVGSYQTF